MAAVDELLRLLEEAAAVVSNYGAMNLYCPFDTGAEFAAELQSLRERVARKDWSASDRWSASLLRPARGMTELVPRAWGLPTELWRCWIRWSGLALKVNEPHHTRRFHVSRVSPLPVVSGCVG